MANRKQSLKVFAVNHPRQLTQYNQFGSNKENEVGCNAKTGGTEIFPKSFHSTRHSFSKRAFGRDLSNLQEGKGFREVPLKVSPIPAHPAQQFSKHRHNASNHGLYSNVAIQHLNQPVIMSQAQSATNSLGKMKTISDMKHTSLCMNQTDVQNLLNQIQGTHRSSSRVMERKTISSFSQERSSAHLARANQSFGHPSIHATISASRPMTSFKIDPKITRLRKFNKTI